jgi:NADH-quinone oxidoreductase subunit G
MELVTITVDGKELKVPKGMNVILAAKAAGVDIPHYCYHPHLSVAGNCRMCQVEIEGQPKLAIACNTTATEGLKIKTHFSSEAVIAAQQATMEFLLINHPLDCTVCDQAGHCKLQDYHFEYNGRDSRFQEDKVRKVKAEPLGPEVIYDGERCIMCTRCVRFCDEVTKTSELGAFNRGDCGEIGVFPGKELNNPFSGTVVDLCPVGALTHRRWRFNTRIWYTQQKISICTGCSTGCNVRVATRDNEVVHVKARLNPDVNQEWLCDEGRYGFNRFQPEDRLGFPLRREGESFVRISIDDGIKELAALKGMPGSQDAVVVLSPLLTTEELWMGLEFAERVMGVTWVTRRIALQFRSRSITDLQKILISPDYAPNARALPILLGSDIYLGDGEESKGSEGWRDSAEERYNAVLNYIKSGAVNKLLLVGDFSIPAEHFDGGLASALRGIAHSVLISPRPPQQSSAGKTFRSPTLEDLVKVIVPGRTVNEKNGVMINRELRLQRVNQLLTPEVGSLPDWMFLSRAAAVAGIPILPGSVADDRALFRELCNRIPAFAGLTLMQIGEQGLKFNGETFAPAAPPTKSGDAEATQGAVA